MPLRRWVDSVNNAIEGILYAARTQPHVRYHLYSAAIILLVSYVLGIERTDFLVITVAVILVLLAEMMNTAVEYVVDMISPEFSDKARIAKDVAAGAVLITAFGAVVLGYIILFPYFSKIFEQGLSVAHHSREEMMLISVVIVLIVVIMMKSYFGTGHPLRGGMPSGHAAIAFSVWTAVTIISRSFSASLACFILSMLIAQSRIAVKAHRPIEVIAGALLGAFTTGLLFAIFYL